ncbi:conserved hypothetical protein [Leishmania major strain Friedlin]|uniref:Uncharacterized protein n=1 Tax=Leishmania major TaxID=5664 RepID=E9AFG0_LEIMA|nr:conserved hypothetical protein [Leishmania major strain Friedlin]CAG9582691.1 Putative_death-receptor_fusion_protein_(DUF2428)_-_putative [Leishmania major strain Friedlin]CBZ12964.1 conserved hypothetical protein [Leishmania major strain Friedlin]|eukprot:XP_003722730.1 conserved hypothetical protein [Leishmania major strain Friedlin]
MAEQSANATLTRRRQRRPDLQSTFDVPEDVRQPLEQVARALFVTAPSSALAAKVVRTTDAALQELLQLSLTPEQQLHAISKMTGAIREIPKSRLAATLTEPTGELHSWSRTLALEAVVPLLLDCRVRYLHRALMTLLRTLLPAPDAAAEATVREMYVARILHSAKSWEADTATAMRPVAALGARSDTSEAAAAVYFPSSSEDRGTTIPAARSIYDCSAERDRVLNFLNAVDGLTSTLMPMMPGIFKDTFLEVLPLLADSFQWVVVNATSHSRVQASIAPDASDGAGTLSRLTNEAAQSVTNADGEASNAVAVSVPPVAHNADAAAVFGEDLEHIRFCVRVVAAYIHKYMDSLTLAMASGATSDSVRRDLTRLLQPTIVMLYSPIFPKDVLNAVGLLVASILTVRTCDAWLLAFVCAALRDDVAQCTGGAARLLGAETSTDSVPELQESGTAGALSLAHLFAQADVALRIVSAANPREAAQADGGSGAKALHDVFSHLTPNGCFALLKGILAHTSAPIRGDWMSLGLLLRPLPWTSLSATGAENAPSNVSHGTVVAYDIILQAAQQYCNVVQEPETRFMAIQTVDSVVRHVSSVLTIAVKALAQSAKNEGAAALTKLASSQCSLECATPEVHQATALRRHLSSLCTSSPKLQNALSYATQLIMALWDDGTQQMSGALYGTYGEILRIHALLRGSASHAPGEQIDHDVDTSVTLDQILQAQAERRGKYHALLGLLSMMPLGDFIAALQRHYGYPNAAADAVSAFSRTLLTGASNHKIGNVAGDVFAHLARGIAKAPPGSAIAGCSCDGETAEYVMRRGIIEPLARAITEKGYVGVSSNVSEAVNISHITAHFVAPLVKQDPACLRAILTAVAASLDGASYGQSSLPGTLAAPEYERVEQGVVETVARARGVGVDITPYLAPGSTTLRVLEEGSRSLNYEVRNTALCLCVLGAKKIQAVQPWQLRRVEEYIIFNMHLGGDSTARKGLLEMVKKWVRRLMESYTSKPQNGASASAAASATPKKAHTKGERQENAVATAQRSGATSLVAVSASEPDLQLELGTAAYRVAVMDHCRCLSSIFAQNIGTSARAGAGLSVERRVTAMMGYSILLQGLRTHVAKKEAMQWAVATEPVSGGAALPLLHICVVPSLLAALSDGWSQARESARELLRTFCELAPTVVFTATNGIDGGSAASPSAMAARAHQDLLRAQTFRNAEGAVGRFLTFTTLTAEAQEAARQRPLEELERLSGLLERERTSVEGKCAEMSAMRGTKAYAYIQANPLHGTLSLCAELLSLMASVECRAAAASPSSLLTLACTNLLQCCCLVLRTCSSLVGTETMAAGTTASSVADEVVDCRGHVYDRSRPEAESAMRGVVNNTWLSMRVAAGSITRLLKIRPVNAMPFAAVHAAAYELVHALLLTKHNGVMRCVREALKALVVTLVRSRQTLFYQLPAELLEYLMGPEGVTSGHVTRMLRRSQGLPHAILAVLEAEDTTVPCCLFPSAMRQLLRVARSDIAGAHALGGAETAPLGVSAETVRRSQRSNALNVLKFIFEDKVFADRAVAYIEEAFSLATEGFHDASWYTRNSSLMLFSAVIHRFVGEHPSTGGSGVNTSLHDVAKRMPRSIAYAYAELTRGSRSGQEAKGEDGGAASAAEVSVALFPVLQLLSMLSPDPPHLITKVSHGESDDAARMIEAVMQCAGSPSLMVRSASAVALCCLVPLSSLRRTIEQTRRGLSLELLQPHRSLTDSANHAGPLKQRGGAAGGGLNSCHGAVLQLLQFHAQYVGTLRRHYRQKRSSYATLTVAEAVIQAISEALLSCKQALVRACTVSATVAASLFALLADIVFYGARHKLSPGQQHAVRGMCVEAMTACLKARHVVSERGSVMEGVSAMLVLLAAQRERAPIGHWTGVEQARLAELLQEEAAALSIRRGEHNLISWVMTQLRHYSDAADALNRADVAVVLRVISRDLHCDLPQLALKSLTELFDGAASPASPMTMTIGCVAWGQLVSHMRFAAMAMTLTNKTAGATTAPPHSSDLSSFDAGQQTPAVKQLHSTLLSLLTLSADGDDSTTATPLHNSDACSAALDFLTTHDIYVSDAHAVSPAVAYLLSYYCEPGQPLESRLAVVKALRTAQSFLRCSAAAATSSAASTCPGSAVTLFLVLLRLLVDDTSEIREAAAAICSRGMWGAHEAPRDQVSCLLAVVRLLRRLRDTGLLFGVDALRFVMSLADSPTTASVVVGTAPAEEAGDGEEVAGSDDEDVLFQKEAANMFAEKTVLSHLAAHILGNATSDTATMPVCFSVYDSFLV